MFTLTGTIKLKRDEQVISGSFKKREFVLTDASSNYPQHITFQLTQDRCIMLDNFNEGDQVAVSFNLRGREWVNKEGETKYFNSLEVWKIEGAGSAADAGDTDAGFADLSADDAADDDLPF